MSRFNVALEDDEVVIEDSTGKSELAELQVVEQTGSSEQVDTLEAASDGLGEIKNVIQSEVDEAGALSPQTAAIAEVAVECILASLGAKKKIGISTESLKDDSKKLAASKHALERITLVQTKVNDSLAVAQEGFFTDIATGISMLFQTEKKVLKRLSSLDLNNSKEGKQFHNDSWAKYIPAPEGNIEAKSIIKILEKAVSDSKNINVQSTITDLSRLLGKLSTEVNGTWFYSNKNDIERIEKIDQELSERVEKLKSELASGLDGKKSERIFTSATTQEAKEIHDLCVKLLDTTDLDYVVRKFGDEEYLLRYSILNASQIRLAGDYAEDINKAEDVAKKAGDIIEAIKYISTQRVKLVSAITSYLEASTK